MQDSSTAGERVDVVDGQATAGSESRNIAVLVWVGTFFLSFFPSLIVFFVTKDDYVKAHAREALNLSIMVMAGYLIGTLTAVILIGFLVLLVVTLYYLIYCIKGALKAYRGEDFRAPFLFRLIR